LPPGNRTGKAAFSTAASPLAVASDQKHFKFAVVCSVDFAISSRGEQCVRPVHNNTGFRSVANKSCTLVSAADSTLAEQPISLSQTALPKGTHNITYSQTITVSGATGLTFSVLNVTNPIPGLNIGPAMGYGGSSLTITGKPTAAGTETILFMVSDGAGHVEDFAYTITVI
jgi:hypothetical protein